MKVVDPLKVFAVGQRQFVSLDSAERIVYLVMCLETDAEMQGWDCFFASANCMYYDELKSALITAEDENSTRVLMSYEKYLSSRNVSMNPESIAEFLSKVDDDYPKRSSDWRSQFMAATEGRWDKIAHYLSSLGYRLERD